MNLSVASSKPCVVPPETLAYFQSNPWANSLLSSPDYIPVETSSRTAKPTGGDSFFAETLGAANVIPHCLTLLKRDIVTPSQRPASAAEGETSKSTSAAPKQKQKPKPDMITLFHLERPGVSGHPSFAHGGVVATLLDEIMSLTVEPHIPETGAKAEEIRSRIFTVQLDIRYRRKVEVPGLVVVKAWCAGAEGGRKFWMRGEIVQEEGEGEGENGGGGGGHLEWAKRKRVCAEANGFWLAARPEKL